MSDFDDTLTRFVKKLRDRKKDQDSFMLDNRKDPRMIFKKEVDY